MIIVFPKVARMKCLKYLTLFQSYFDAIGILIYTDLMIYLTILRRHKSREKQLLTIANINIVLSNDAQINSRLYFIQIS